MAVEGMAATAKEVTGKSNWKWCKVLPGGRIVWHFFTV